MLTIAEREKLIGRIREFPQVLGDMVRGLREDQLDTPCGEGEWTVRQVVHHVTDACLNYFIRMKLVLTEEKPILKPFQQDEWARLPDSLCASPEGSLSILRGLHARWADLIESVPEPAWERWGMHLELGKLTLDDLLVNINRHSDEHLAQIGRLRKKAGW